MPSAGDPVMIHLSLATEQWLKSQMLYLNKEKEPLFKPGLLSHTARVELCLWQLRLSCLAFLVSKMHFFKRREKKKCETYIFFSVKPMSPADNWSNSVSVNKLNNSCEWHNYSGSQGPPSPGDSKEVLAELSSWTLRQHKCVPYQGVGKVFKNQDGPEIKHLTFSFPGAKG